MYPDIFENGYFFLRTRLPSTLRRFSFAYTRERYSTIRKRFVLAQVFSNMEEGLRFRILVCGQVCGQLKSRTAPGCKYKRGDGRHKMMDLSGYMAGVAIHMKKNIYIYSFFILVTIDIKVPQYGRVQINTSPG